MSVYHRLVLAALVAALLLPLGACGKKNRPEPPPDQQDEFPRSYPRPGT